jgi:hypothetical protein
MVGIRNIDITSGGSSFIPLKKDDEKNGRDFSKFSIERKTLQYILIQVYIANSLKNLDNAKCTKHSDIKNMPKTVYN